MARGLVIGSGPAGLMAAEQMADRGLDVLLVDQMAAPARKFLMAGKSGLNLTKQEAREDFLAAFSAPEVFMQAVAEFGPREVMEWARALEQPLFTGTTGRVFPQAMKASPLLRAWLARLDQMGVELRNRWRWSGWEGEAVRFETPAGTEILRPDVVVLACGGASWSRLGSDGRWADLMPTGSLTPFAPSNTGVLLEWSAHMRRHWGSPVKGIALRAGGFISRGEIVVTENGIEGGGIYTLSAPLRKGATLLIDLVPDIPEQTLRERLARSGGKASLSNQLRKAGLDPVKRALLMEFGRPLPDDLAALIKALPIPITGMAPLDQAISTAGGLRDSALDGWMLRARPGVFAAGEMLDWDAPTGGYLITGALASGRAAGRAAADFALGMP